MAAGKYMNIPREEIPWFPAIDEDLCTNCGSCIEFCANGVFALDDVQTRVVAPYNCVVGCSACETECTSHAVRFPDKQELVKVLRELRAQYVPQAG
jgi:NAD-dependent dihydropyrimidine dehydrogenase PreA subunit